MATLPLTDTELEEALTRLPGWRVEADELTAVYRTRRADVLPLYTEVAAAEDEADHHARVTVLYGTVSFALNTHDADGAITAKDTALAARIAAIAAAHGATVTG